MNCPDQSNQSPRSLESISVDIPHAIPCSQIFIQGQTIFSKMTASIVSRYLVLALLFMVNRRGGAQQVYPMSSELEDENHNMLRRHEPSIENEQQRRELWGFSNLLCKSIMNVNFSWAPCFLHFDLSMNADCVLFLRSLGCLPRTSNLRTTTMPHPWTPSRALALR